jgi:hypothetical protein
VLGIWDFYIFTKVTFQCDPGSNNYICHRDPSPFTKMRGHRCIVAGFARTQRRCVFFSTLHCGSRTQRRCVFFSTSSPCSLEIASSPWLLAMTVIISVIASPTAVGRGNPRVLPRDCFGRLTPPSSQRSLPSFQHFATLVSKTKCCCVKNLNLP